MSRAAPSHFPGEWPSIVTMTTSDATTPDEQWPTQSTSTDTMPIEPPPSGLAASDDAGSGPTDWQARYEAEHKRSRIFMVATALLGAGFMALKAVEYAKDFRNGLVPGAGFALPERGAEIFFSFYWIMTAIHAVHLTIGVAAVSFAAWRLWRGAVDWRGTAFLHVLGLYWHLIDLIWIFLFPLLYLLGRGG